MSVIFSRRRSHHDRAIQSTLTAPVVTGQRDSGGNSPRPIKQIMVRTRWTDT
ncbi:hypothetical protein AGABI2DRAFT_153982 [Agaricus bisporus var. bisporus H97]|uniref:hypothetical protein n=1 Tax=Agaricus bisporus var. bisporus (strain H97 / ATCC MYA-4626 / FGSC 10389) TaxID=936046 RepID=UPI00029F714A|nr:hypothetical protein AGABI2DRAFT_153982 [Agaricus bisporus var. bisporus H97]EKV42683.1 hypothetical protein AGABI2DRAFT_153982 [Agaricus bisporus var. bisporus H97]